MADYVTNHHPHKTRIYTLTNNSQMNLRNMLMCGFRSVADVPRLSSPDIASKHLTTST